MFVPTDAAVLHADVDAFFASVEQRDDPRLRGKPVVVGQGVVMAASYEARAYGVRGAMGGAQARRLCPDLIALPPRFAAYSAASEELFELFREVAPAVEGLSMEEAFLDVRGLEHVSGTPVEIAARLRSAARERTGLPLTVGIARTKTLAKMASRAAKPDGLLLVEPAYEREFLDPLPVESLWGVGPSTATKLHALGIETVGQVAELPVAALTGALGSTAGRHLYAVAHNRDPRRVRSGRSRRSFGSQSALGRRSRDRAEVDAILLALVDRVTRRMRSAGRLGRTVVLRLRFADFRRASRSRTLARATASAPTVLAAARGLLDTATPMIRRRGLTLIGLALTNLERSGGEQLELDLGRRHAARLEAALDQLRDCYGNAVVTRGSLLRAAPELAPWVRPSDRAQ
jgi:DNA polymerase-4